MDDERRQTQRKNSIYYLEVFDRTTTFTLGRLVDITTKGMMLISPAPIEAGKHFQARISLPTSLSSGEFLDIDCRSAWSTPSINSDFYDTGFEFTETSDHDSLTIELLIKYFAFDG